MDKKPIFKLTKRGEFALMFLAFWSSFWILFTIDKFSIYPNPEPYRTGLIAAIIISSILIFIIENRKRW